MRQPNPIEKFWQWLLDQLGRMISSASSSRTGLSPLQAMAVGLGLILLVAAVVLGWRRFGGAGRTSRARGGVFAATSQLSAAEHRRQAASAEAAERWAEAVIEWFRAVARELEERTILAPAPGRTAHEVAAEAAARLPQLADRLRAGARSFDDIVYGERGGSAAAAAALRTLDDAVRRAPVAPTAPTLVTA